MYLDFFVRAYVAFRHPGLKIIFLQQYLFIAIFCAKMSSVYKPFGSLNMPTLSLIYPQFWNVQCPPISIIRSNGHWFWNIKRNIINSSYSTLATILDHIIFELVFEVELQYFPNLSNRIEIMSELTLLSKALVPNLFLLTYPHAEKRKPTYPLVSQVGILWHFQQKSQCKSKANENQAYPLRFLTYPWLGTAGLKPT